jgi:NitT/TauT family transport system substrate-binding protein
MRSTNVVGALSRSTFLLGAAAVTAPRAASAQAVPRLTTIGLLNDGFTPCMYAIRNGIFAKYGVTVEPTFIGSGAAAAAAVIGGTADVGFFNIVTTISARAKKVPLHIVAPGPVISTQSFGTNALLVSKDAPIRTAQDLNGKTLGGSALGDLGVIAAQAWIDKNGGNSRTVRFVEITPGTAAQLLAEGRIAAASINEPLASQVIAGGEVRLLANPLLAIAPTFLAAIYGVMEAVADKQREAMRRFSLGIREATAYTNTHMRETVDLVASFTGATPETVARSVRNVDAEYVDAAQIQPVIDALANYGVIGSTFPATTLISPYAARRGR